MNNAVKLHLLTKSAMEELQYAFLECAQKSVEGRILSAIVSIRMAQDILIDPDFASSYGDREEFSRAY